MMIGSSKWHVLLGVVLGLATSMGLLSVDHGRVGSAPQSAGPLLSDCDGTLRQVVIHYSAEAADVLVPTYRTFLRQLPVDVTVHVVCPDQQAYDDLLARIGETDCRLSPVIVGHPITAWSRDRWLALGACGSQPAVLLYPRGEDGAAVWPAREGDERVAGDLAVALGSGVASRRSDLYFDGGDFAADSETVFVRPAVLFRNLQRTVETREELLDHLAAILKRQDRPTGKCAGPPRGDVHDADRQPHGTRRRPQIGRAAPGWLARKERHRLLLARWARLFGNDGCPLRCRR